MNPPLSLTSTTPPLFPLEGYWRKCLSWCGKALLMGTCMHNLPNVRGAEALGTLHYVDTCNIRSSFLPARVKGKCYCRFLTQTPFLLPVPCSSVVYKYHLQCYSRPGVQTCDVSTGYHHLARADNEQFDKFNFFYLNSARAFPEACSFHFFTPPFHSC